MRFSRLRVITIALILTTSVKGQVGNEFWFAAPDISQSHYNNSIPLVLHITAMHATHVTISRPADPAFTPVEFDLGAEQTQEIRMDNQAAFNNLGVDDIETYARNAAAANFVQDKGFLITAEGGEITAYYEPVGRNNTDIVALKAHNGLGKDFWVSTQRKYKNHGYADDFSGFTVVATMDGTVVTVDPNGNNLEYHGTTPFTVTLNKGEAFAARAAGQAPLLHIHGIKVTSTNDIAIIIYDDSMQIDDGGGNWDIFADQIVPTSVVGLEYIVLQGWVRTRVEDPESGEAIFVTPTEDNTFLYIDDGPAIGPFNAGDYFDTVITNLSTHVRATKPIYVNHITGYSTNSNIRNAARELGGAILPPIDKCTGSHSVTVKRSPASGFVYFVNLMVRNDTLTGSPTKNQAIHNFTYSINGGPDVAINPNHFTYIMDSAFAFYDRTKAGGNFFYNALVDGDILRVENPMSRFHMGVMQAKQSPGCKVGYFSDFAANDASAGIGGYLQGNSKIFCNLNPIQIVANGGTSYKWYAPVDSALVGRLDYDSVPDPFFFPDTSGIFYFNVVITGECQSKDTLNTQIVVMQSNASSFSFSGDEGCSPFAPIVANQSDTIAGGTQVWTIKPATGSAYQIDQADTSRTFSLTLPDNNTDSIQTHTVELVVKGPFNSCPSTTAKNIKVKPYVEAGFNPSDTMGCHPLAVSFENLSSGNLDSTSYYWDFGDNTQSFDSIPGKSYSNYTLENDTFSVRLITESPFECYDTAWKDIVVHPRVKANIAADTTASCTPLIANLSPAVSFGLDTLHWYIDLPPGYTDSSFSDTNLTPLTINHSDTSTASGPDTLYITLIGENRMGCVDTAPTRQLIVYPEVDADFTLSDNVVCDSIPILINNNSFGYKLFYDWDFGNNTFSQDTMGNSYTKVYFNRFNDEALKSDTTYYITLTATSDYYCEDVMVDSIIVHPYVNADFGMGYANNCSPLHAEITNTSIGQVTSWWDFGSGSMVINNNDTIYQTFTNPFDNLDTTYNVKLRVRNSFNCYDSIVRPLTLFPRVVADFIFSTDSVGCAPLNIGFENRSTGGNLTYTWDYGDNSSSTVNDTTFNKSFNNVTDNDTTYYVTLTARNLLGCDSVITRPVEVYAYIDASFALPVTDSCSPFTIRPDNLSSPGAKVFDWNFGHATSSLFEPVVPAYIKDDETIGNYNVTLIAAGAADAAHLACADTHIIPVTVYPELEADFILDATESCQPLISSLKNNTNMLDSTSFSWYVDQNFYSSDQSPPDSLRQFNYSNVDDTLTIYLYGRSNFNCQDTATQEIIVYSYVDAFFSVAPSVICSADSFQIDQTFTQGGIVSRNWDYNGETSDGETNNRFYRVFTNPVPETNPVDKYVTLTIENSHSCTDVYSDTITVYPQVVANFDPDSATVCYPHVTQFENNSDNATKAHWVFGDGASSLDLEPDHLFNNFSPVDDITFNVKLTATSDYNCFDTLTKPVTIYAKPNSDFFFPVAVACPPFDVEMLNNSSGSALTYYWDFAGESTSIELNPNYTFSNSTSSIQDKAISLRVLSDRGCSDTLIKTASVYPDVNVDFNFTTDQGCSPLEVSFTGDTTNVLQMLWYIDGKAFSTIKDPTYLFQNETPGDKIHDIRFEARSLYDCSADTTKQVTVYPSPIAEFIPSPLPAPYGTANDETVITFNNQTVFQDTWTYEWDYGDGNIDSETQQVFEHVYGEFFWGENENGNRIPVTLRAWNAANPECRDSVTREITIYPPIPEIDLAEDIYGCQPFTVDFSAYTKYNYDSVYKWEFGKEGEISSEKEPTYTFEKEGTYTVKLEIEGEGGSNWDFKIVHVNPKPQVVFAFNDSVVFDSSQTKGYDWINFYNQTSYADKFYWYFNSADNLGGTPDSEERDPAWFYDEVGEYYVGLIAESGEGCLDTLVHPTPIIVMTEGYVKFPTAFFVSPDGPDDEYNTSTLTNRYVFYPLSSGVAEYRLEIYNRWGARVFESKDITRGWNGYIDGAPAKQDVYIYRCRGSYTNGQPYDMSGDVTLIHGRDEVTQ